MKGKGVVLTSETHSKQFRDTFIGFFKSNVLTDVTLICDDKVRIEAHKLVLCAGSSFFRDFLVYNNANSHPMIFLKGVKQQELQPLVQFLYNGETTVPQEDKLGPSVSGEKRSLS